MNLLSSLLAFTARQIGALKNTATALTTRIGTAESGITNLDSRVTNLAHLTDGSTTGDAELIDGRTSSSETGSQTYGNIGKAIRTQVSEVKRNIGIAPYAEMVAVVHKKKGAATERPTPTITTDTQIKRDGTRASVTGFNIATYSVSANKLYEFAFRCGSSYQQMTALELYDSNGNLVGSKFADKDAYASIFIHSIDGTVAVCYRNAYDLNCAAWAADTDTASAEELQSKENSVFISDDLLARTNFIKSSGAVTIKVNAAIRVWTNNRAFYVAVGTYQLSSNQILYVNINEVTSGHSDEYPTVRTGTLSTANWADKVILAYVNASGICGGLLYEKYCEAIADQMWDEVNGNAVDISGYAIHNNAYLNGSGGVSSTSSDYCYTDPIPVKKGYIVYAPNVSKNANIRTVAKVLVNGSVYKPLTGNTFADCYYLIDEDCEIALCETSTNIGNHGVRTGIYQLFNSIENSTTITPTRGQITYIGDTKNPYSHLVNAVAYEDGVIIGARSNGTVVRIGYTGEEEVVLTVDGYNVEWRGLFMDSNENVYASPHATNGALTQTDRGLYRLEKGASSMTKVISLYDPNSSVPTEQDSDGNSDTIWTICEDDLGYLYAGVYAHGSRNNPAIYRSTDSGHTWTYLINFNTAGLTTNGRHTHTVIFDKWKNRLYCIIGEINTIFKSDDHGATWTDLHVTLSVKGSSMIATPNGVFIGSDGAYNCDIDWLHNDDITHEKVYRGWANTIFAIRQSDVTGFLYAFTKIDISADSTDYFPPATAIDATGDEFTQIINAWKLTVPAARASEWQAYYDSVIEHHPSDAVRPRHYSILVSRDGGKNWDVLFKGNGDYTRAEGFWCTGYFRNGECLTGAWANGDWSSPIIISEGRHKYVADGCDLNGEIFIRTNVNPITPVL